MIQCLKHKAKERPEKRRGNKVNELRPPHLEQPGQGSNILHFFGGLVSLYRQPFFNPITVSVQSFSMLIK